MRSRTSSCLKYFLLQKNLAGRLRDFAEAREISNGKALHSRILKSIPKPHLFLSNSLANMYSKCRSIGDARRVLDEMPERDVVSWNTIVDGYFLSGLFLDALLFFREMLRFGVSPDEFSFTSVFRCCGGWRYFGCGLAVHGVVTKYGFGDSAFVANGIVEFYAKFHSFSVCKRVFDGLECKDIVFVSTVIGLLAKGGFFEEAFVMFRDDVLASNMMPTRATFANFLGGIDGCELWEQGIQVHALVLKFGFEGDGSVENSLVSMYANCDRVDDAFDLLVQLGSKNVMSWTTLIKGYTNIKCFQGAMDAFFWVYHEVEAIDNVFLACVLTAAADLKCFQVGSQLHCTICKSGLESDSCVIHSLLDMYAKCGSMEEALKLFQQIDHDRSNLSWTTMISANAQNGFSMEALRLFRLMNKEGTVPDSVACLSVLVACVDLQAIHQGEQVHAFVVKSGCEADISVQTALISLYSECGRLPDVTELFQTMTKHDVVSWTAVISAYTKLGYREEALIGLVKMLQGGFRPNHFTLASALTASAKIAFTYTGKSLHALVTKSGLEEDKSVGSALIDMYSKCGSIQSAVNYFKEASKCDIFMWNALLAGHAHHGNVKELFSVYEEMQNHDMKPDGITFLALLAGCSHGGLVDQVIRFYDIMQDEYRIRPEVEHCACVVNAFGRAGLFGAAVNFVQEAGFKAGPEVWRTFISSCATFGLVQLGLAAVAKAVVAGQTNNLIRILTSNLYAFDEKWVDAKRVRESLEANHVNIKEAAMSWIVL